MDRWVKIQISFVLFSLGIASFCLSCSSSEQKSRNFEELSLQICDYGLFDLGVTDINNDDLLDIFTVNHSGRQSLLLNRGSGRFDEIFPSMKMDQDPVFPGLVVTAVEPQMTDPGVYVYWYGPDLVVRSVGLPPSQAVSGRVEVLSPVEITEKNNFEVAVTAKDVPSGATHSTIEFTGTGQSGGYFYFTQYIHALPIQFHIDANISVDKVYIGPDRITPNSLEFAIRMRDRHGMAWVDLNHDQKMDLFITRGGLRGTMKSIPMDFYDELFISTPSVMTDVGTFRGLDKDGCPGRQAAWVDYNSDDLLDIYVACGRERNVGHFPNKLYRQAPDGNFVDVAAQVGLDVEVDGTFQWVDTDLDGDMDLFWSDEKGFTLYRNGFGSFVPDQIEVNFDHGRSGKITAADFDNDGDIDLFSAALKGNVLFVNNSDRLSPANPSPIGLPQKSLTANWVDCDNDGRVDLYSVPGGLYRQKKNGTFKSTPIMDVRHANLSPYKLVGSRAAWFDADNNGTRDLVVSNKYARKNRIWTKFVSKMTKSDERFGKLNYFWNSRFFLNKDTLNHWIQIQLVGPPSNRQAIGARVTVTTPEGVQSQHIGGADGSHYSQGHFRLYFGLGVYSKASKINVTWPDGHSTDIFDREGDRLIKINRNMSD